MGVEEEGNLGGEVIDEQAGLEGGIHVGDGVGEGEGDFLNGGGAGFADVVAANRDGIPTGDVLRAVLENVGDKPHGGRGREDVGAAGDVLLEDVVLDGAAQLARVDALLAGDGDIHGEQDGGGGVDGHGCGDLVKGDVLEEGLHVVDGGDGDADLADFAVGDGVVGIVADLRGEVEGDGEAGLTVLEEIAIALIGIFGAGEAGILAHGPEAGAIHGGLDAAGEGVFAGEAELVEVVGVVVWGRGRRGSSKPEEVSKRSFRSGYFLREGERVTSDQRVNSSSILMYALFRGLYGASEN